MTNLHDVARAAGVSPSTVSRVVRDDPNVSDETRERVLRMMAETNYIPNVMARSLKHARSALLSLIISDFTSPFFASVARGAEARSREAGYSLVLSNSDQDPELEAFHLEAVGQQRVGGVILTPTIQAGRALLQKLPPGTPLVTLDTDIPGVQADLVTSDTRSGVRDLVLHLAGLGHGRIAFIGGMTSSKSWYQRVTGYRDGLAAAGIPMDERLIMPLGWNPSDGALAIRELLVGELLPDAIISANAQICLGVLDTMGQHGLRMPDDVAIASIDDPFPTTSYLPTVTAVLQPGYEMGARAVELVLARLLLPDGTLLLAEVHRFPSTLRIGTSCGEAGT